jgi:hypothetical protein
MVPDLEAMGIRMLLNECEPIERGVYLAARRRSMFLTAAWWRACSCLNASLISASKEESADRKPKLKR